MLLMEEIRHHLGCIKPCNSGIFTISTGAGFLPSTVPLPLQNPIRSMGSFWERRSHYWGSLEKSLTRPILQNPDESRGSEISTIHTDHTFHSFLLLPPSPLLGDIIQGSLYYQPKPCIFKGKCPKITICLHCFIPPIITVYK